MSPYIEERFLISESTIHVKRFYNRFELNVPDEFRDLPDHIPTDLELIRCLSFNEGMPVGSGRNYERNVYIDGQKIPIKLYTKTDSKICKILKESYVSSTQARRTIC